MHYELYVNSFQKKKINYLNYNKSSNRSTVENELEKFKKTHYLISSAFQI